MARILLFMFAGVALLLASGAWFADPNKDNQGGVLVALVGLLVMICVLAVAATRWLSGRLSRQRRP